MKGKVYILEDDTSICGLIKVALEMNGLSFRAFSTVKSFEEDRKSVGRERVC